MFSSHSRLILSFVGVVLAPLFLYLGCRRAAESPLERVAVIPFEYQGTNPDSAWLGTALGVAAFEQMRAGEGRTSVLVSDGNSAAQRAATLIVKGLVSGNRDAVRLRLSGQRHPTVSGALRDAVLQWRQ